MIPLLVVIIVGIFFTSGILSYFGARHERRLAHELEMKRLEVEQVKAADQILMGRK